MIEKEGLKLANGKECKRVRQECVKLLRAREIVVAPETARN